VSQASVLATVRGM